MSNYGNVKNLDFQHKEKIHTIIKIKEIKKHFILNII